MAHKTFRLNSFRVDLNMNTPFSSKKIDSEVMNVALCQINVGGDKLMNIGKAANAIDSSQHADLLVSI